MAEATKKKTYRVYMYTSKIDGRRYVGVTKRSMAKRALGGKGYRGSPHFYAAILKYGFESFTGETVAEGLTKEEAAEMEKELIGRHHTMFSENGFNLHRGGFETCYDNVCEREGRIERIKATLRKQRSDPEVRAIMRERMKSVWDDPEKRSRILESRSGKFGGRPPRPVYCLETDSMYISTHHAERALGVALNSLTKRLEGRPAGYLHAYTQRGGEFTFHLGRERPSNVDVKRAELLEKPESSADHSVPGNRERDGMRTEEIGLSAAEPLEHGEGSETIPEGSRGKRPEAARFVSDFGF